MIMEDCDRLISVLYDNRNIPKDKFLEKCVVERGMSIYDKQNDDFDMSLRKLDSMINYLDENQVKKYCKKLLSLSASSRKALINTLGRLM